MAEQGATWAAFIESEVKTEYDRRSTLDARALAFVTSSTSFIALVAALLALVRGKDQQFSDAGAGWVVGAMVVLLIAAAIGLFANQARRYEVAMGTTLLEMVDGHWQDSEVDARNICARLNIDTVVSLRRGNNRKASVLAIAGVFQIVGLVALVVGALIEVM